MAGWAVGVVRDTLGLTLGLAMLWKVRDFRQFRASLGGFGFPVALRTVTAVAVLAAEALTATLAFLPGADRVVGGLGAGLGLVFLASQTYLVATGNPTPCACFGGAGTDPVSMRSLARAAAVLVAGLVVLVAGVAVPREPELGALLVAPVLLAAVALGLRAVPVAHRRVPGSTT